MADEQDRWLDRETAEILLRGESLEAVDPADRDRAERLARALGALSAPPVPSGGELPGEAAALAAFRAARAERKAAPTGTPAAAGSGAGAQPSDAGLIRIGPRGDGTRQPRWSRPLRFGLAAALTAGMVGGVAVAAGTGVLPAPFDGAEPEPAATVSAAASPDHSRTSPSPLEGVEGGPAPGGPARGAPDRGGAKSGADGGTAEDRGSDPGAGSGDTSHDRAKSGSGRGWPDLAAACRDVRAGREPEGARGRALKDAAGGSSRVGKYCGDLLAGSAGSAPGRGRGKDGREPDESGESEKGSGGSGGRGGKGDKPDKEGNGGNSGKGGNGGNGGKGGEGGKKGGGDKGGKDDDDDGPHITPPPGHHHGPRAPWALPPLAQQRPAYPAHTSSAFGDALRPALSRTPEVFPAAGVTLSGTVAQ
ncbi:hypothetical protein [Streptomyces sp. MH13]|uniref:hypothetical protein n=1 Tax=Streptomyces sp. MH13 TaxID=3417651 RepID=UPI003CF1CBCB